MLVFTIVALASACRHRYHDTTFAFVADSPFAYTDSLAHIKSPVGMELLRVELGRTLFHGTTHVRLSNC